MSKEKHNHFVGVEIGTTKVAMAVTRVLNDKLEVVALAQAPHKGMHQGQIVDPREITSALMKVKSELEITTNLPIQAAYLTVADLSYEVVYSKGAVAVKKTVGFKDVEAVVKTATESAQIRSDREALHSIPQFFRIGNQKHQMAPLSEPATSLESHVIIVTAARKNIQAARECLQGLGIEVTSVVAHAVASSTGLVQKEDTQNGVAVVDVGGSLTNIAAFKEGKLVYLTTLPVGGVNFTQDLAVGLKTPQLSAEKIKKSHGAALVDLVSADEMVDVESLKGEAPRAIRVRLMCEILEARSEETLGLILKKLNDEDLLLNLKSGILVTGGGSQLPGFPELGEFTFDIPLRRGVVRDIVTSNPLAQSPAMSTVVGLLQYARQQQSFAQTDLSMDTFKGSWGKIKNFIENIL